MLDDFLKDDETTSFLDELEESPKSELALESRGFLDMTPFQRFLISIMFFFFVVIVGSLCLLITGAVAIPIS